MKTIKQYIADQREQSRLQKESRLRAEFNVVERDGYLWLTHQGVAFSRIDLNMQAIDVASMLNDARETAVEFERL